MCYTIRLLVVGLVLAGSCRGAFASWLAIPLEQRLLKCWVVVTGKIEKVTVGDQPDRHATRWSDTAFLKVAAVLKNDLNLPNVKEGATLSLEMPSIKSKEQMSLDFRFKVGDEGVWLLYRTTDGFCAVYPDDLLPLNDQQRVVALLATLKAEQAAVTQQTREAAKHHAAERDAVPLYTLDQFNVDAKREITPVGDPDQWQMTFVVDDKGNQGGLALDRYGSVMLATSYYVVGGFSEGLALVGTRSDRIIKDYGFIDKMGKLVIAADYDGGEGFSERMALVSRGGRCFYIDKSGKQVSAKYQTGASFKNGIGQMWDGETTYLVRKDGTVVYQCRRWDAGFWSDGLLYVGMRGYVNATGQLAVDCSEKALGIWTGHHRSFHEGMAAVQGEKQLWGFISKEGKLAILPHFVQIDEMNQFSEGLVAVAMRQADADGLLKWGYVDQTGKMVIEPQYDRAGPFSEGLAAVQVSTWVADPATDKPAVREQRYGYINKEGKLAVGAWFVRAEPFRNGLARVSEDAYHTGYINREGKYVWQTLMPEFHKGKP